MVLGRRPLLETNDRPSPRGWTALNRLALPSLRGASEVRNESGPCGGQDSKRSGEGLHLMNFGQARSDGQNQLEPEPLLVGAKKAAVLCGKSLRTWRAWDAAG